MDESCCVSVCLFVSVIISRVPSIFPSFVPYIYIYIVKVIYTQHIICKSIKHIQIFIDYSLSLHGCLLPANVAHFCFLLLLLKENRLQICFVLRLL